MKQKYHHLSLEEREKLAVLLASGLSLRKAAKALNRADTTLSRELRRNKKYGITYLWNKYLPCKANRLAQNRELKQRTKAPLKEPLVFLYVREHLRLGWSPEQIAGRLTLDFPDKKITKETIYRYIYHKKNRRFKLWHYLCLNRKKRRIKLGRKVYRDGKILSAKSIDLRPAVVSLRTEPGHWETDNLEGVRSDKVVVSVTVERVARFTCLAFLTSKTAKIKSQAVIKDLEKFPPSARKTLTADNGAENSGHVKIAQALDTQVFFCHAYHAWEKGTVENINQRLRRFLPKGESFGGLTKASLRRIEERINNTPRKCLAYLTPYEKMQQILLKDCCTST